MKQIFNEEDFDEVYSDKEYEDEFDNYDDSEDEEEDYQDFSLNLPSFELDLGFNDFPRFTSL
jgi:hypothetical protein